jgi:membrane protein DedA with SNARE-associated domain
VDFGYKQSRQMKQLLQPLMDWYAATLQNGGFPLVALLMAIESSVVPLPSEVIIPPAAHLAWTAGLPLLGSQLAGWPALMALVVAATIGSWVGASVMYWVSRLAGRPLILNFGGYLLIPRHKIEGAERWADAYGSFGIFAARLLPVVRHLIGIPAGIVRMCYWRYSIYTLLGSALWSSVLCWLGVSVGEHIDKGEMNKVTLILVLFLAGIGALYYFFVHRQMTAKAAAAKAK